MVARSALTRVYPEFDSRCPCSYNLQKGKTMETIDQIAAALVEGKDYAYLNSRIMLSEDVIMKVALSASLGVLLHGKGDAMSVFAGLMPDLLNALDRKRG